MDTQLEVKPIVIHLTQAEEPWNLASRYSEWPKLLRVTAYIICFVNKCRKLLKLSNDTKGSPLALSADECEAVKRFWLKTIQGEVFTIDKKALHQSLSSRSEILPLGPFLDEHKIIRADNKLSSSFLYQTFYSSRVSSVSQIAH